MPATTILALLLVLFIFVTLTFDHIKRVQRRRDRAIALRIIRYLEHAQGRRVA